jgi:predicted tellurium resistance membrane protein TerC
MDGSWLVALIALTAMEIVLGIDNIVFIAIVSSRLPVEQRAAARRLGLALALIMRIALLLTLKWIMGLETPIFHLSDLGWREGWLRMEEHQWEQFNGVSWRDVILLTGGLFLIAKSVFEIHKKLEGSGEHGEAADKVSFAGVLIQIGILDIIFSLDSVITAVGMADQLWVMIVAVMLAVGVMLVFAGTVSAFVERHPTLKMLALSFLILIGVMLVAEGIGTHIDKGYIYFAMFFALVVEFLNLKLRHKPAPQPTA